MIGKFSSALRTLMVGSVILKMRKKKRGTAVFALTSVSPRALRAIFTDLARVAHLSLNIDGRFRIESARSNFLQSRDFCVSTPSGGTRARGSKKPARYSGLLRLSRYFPQVRDDSVGLRLRKMIFCSFASIRSYLSRRCSETFSRRLKLRLRPLKRGFADRPRSSFAIFSLIAGDRERLKAAKEGEESRIEGHRGLTTGPALFLPFLSIGNRKAVRRRETEKGTYSRYPALS